MIRNLLLLQVIITIQKRLLNTAIGNKNFLDINQQSYTLTIWIQLFSSVIDNINQNQAVTILQLNEDYQSFFNLQMAMLNSEFQLIIKTQNRNDYFETDLIIKEKYQWIAFLLNCDGQTLKYNILYPLAKSTFEENLNVQKTRIITTTNKGLTLLIYDEYQETLDNDYFVVNSFPYFDKHQFKVQNEQNLIEIVAYARLILNYQYIKFYISQFEQQNTNILMVYEKIGFNFGYFINQQFDSKLNYRYQITEQLWMKYRISYAEMKINIQIEIHDFNCQGILQLNGDLQKYNTSVIYSLYNYGVIHSKILIVNKYGKNENQIQFCYPGCQNCQYFQCLDRQQQIECRDIEFYNQQTLKCELIVTQRYLSPTPDTYIPRCKVGLYLVNKTCIQCPSYQGIKCLECVINTKEWKNEKACTFSQIVYLQFTQQLFERQGNLYYEIEDDHYKEYRQYNFLQNKDYQNIFLSKTKDVYLTYYDFKANKNYCQIGYHYKNNRCIRNSKSCLEQYKSQCICNQGYVQIRNRCLRCQKSCKFCQFQTKQLFCTIPKTNYFISNSSNLVSCQTQFEKQNECKQDKFKCQDGQFYDIEHQSCNDTNLFHIQQHMIQYIQFNNFPQDLGLQYQSLNFSIYQDHSAFQLKYLSIIEQLHLFSLFTNLNQKNIRNCEFTIYYKNIPYCLKPKQNYLLDNQNQLLYCPQARKCAYKYIIDGIVQITNRAIIIVNDQSYDSFSQIIDLITRNNIQINIIAFNILFQINQQDATLDWGRIFYLEDKYYYQQDIKYAITIQFDKYQYFLNSCDQIQIRFHSIMLQDLNMTFGDLCSKRSNNDRFDLQLIGSYLILNNTNFNNIEKPLSFKLLNSTTTIIFDTKIINCTINEPLLVFELNQDTIITIKNILIQNSVIFDFLFDIIEATQVKFIDFFVTQTKIRQGICRFSILNQNFNILNIIFKLVQSSEAYFIYLSSNYYSGNITASNISFYNCDFHTTIILHVKQIIMIQYLQFSSIRFNQSGIIWSYQSECISISQFKLQNITVINSQLLTIKSTQQIIIENLLISFTVDQLSIFPLFQIESHKCTFLGIKLNNLDNCFNKTLFLFSGQYQIIIEKVYMQGNFQQFSCVQDKSMNKHLFHIIQYHFVYFNDIYLQASLFCHFGLIYAEFEQIFIRSIELKNLTLNQSEIKYSFLYFQPLSRISKIDLVGISINQIWLIVSMQYSLIQIVGFSSIVEITNFEIHDINSTFISNVFGISNLFLFLKQFNGLKLRNMFILQSDSCDVTFHSSIISKVIDYVNHSTPLLSFTSTQQLLISVKIHNIKVYELQNQFLFIYPQARLHSLLMRNIELNINEIKSDVITFQYYKINDQVSIQIHNIIFNLKNENIKIDFYLLNLASRHMVISNVTVNQLTIGFLNASSLSLKIHSIIINNPLSQHQNIFHLTLPESKSVVILSNIFITSQNYYQSNGKSIRIVTKNSLIRIQKIHIQNFVMSSIVSIYQSDSYQNQLQGKAIIRDVILNNMSLQFNIIYTAGPFKIQMEYFNLINIRTQQLFLGIYSIFQLTKSSIINCVSNQSQQYDNVYIHQSQVVDGQIILSAINFNQTYILNQNQDGSERFYSQEFQLFLSLNEGESYFQNQFNDLYYQVLLKEGIDHFYLPSGQQLRQFEYLNVKQQSYEKLYKSISFILKYTNQDITSQCVFKQLIDGVEQGQQFINLQYGLNIMDNLTFISNPYKNQTIKCILSCNYKEQQSNLTFQVRTFPCQLGEYLFQNQCLVCDIDKNYYSVSYKATNCLIKDDSKIEHLKKGQIQLKDNFWRYQLNNKLIEKCDNNCKGGWKVGDNSCYDGHIGAICNECDIYNTRGQGSYGLNQDKCQICQFDYSLIIKGMLIAFWQLLLAYMNFSANSQISNQYLFNRIYNRKLANILDRQNINQVSIILKLISNYLYALYLIKDNFYLGNYIDWSLNLFNNPNMVISPQLDCMLAEQIPINVSYSMLIYRFLTPFLVLNLFFVIYIVLIGLKQQKYGTNVIVIIIFSIYMFNQQLILQSLIKHLSYKFYSNIAWVYSNLSIMYYSDSHKKMIYYLVIPLSVCFWIIPFSIYLYLRKINKSSFKSQQQVGYIYREYNMNCYYWEMMRIYYNFLLMAMMYVFNKQLFLTLILCQTFLLVTQYKKPYSLNNLNIIDQNILEFAQLSFILILYGDKQANILIRYSILISCNIILFQHLIRQILRKAKFVYEKDIILIQQMINKYPKISKYLNLAKKNQIKSMIQMLRSFVKGKQLILQSPTLVQPTNTPQGEIEMQEIK